MGKLIKKISNKISTKTTKLYVTAATVFTGSVAAIPANVYADKDWGKSAGTWLLLNGRWAVGAALLCMAGVMIAKKETVKAILLLLASAVVIMLLSSDGIETMSSIGQTIKSIIGF